MGGICGFLYRQSDWCNCGFYRIAYPPSGCHHQEVSRISQESREWLKLTASLQNSPMAISLLHIIPSNPHLLLLIRIAPYPYNLLNVILASSPALTLRTYTACTALSLCKLVLHTWIGAGLHSLSELHGTSDSGEPLSEEDQQRQDVRWYSTCFGVVLCISLFFYLTHLAKRALSRAQVEHEAREIRWPGQGHVFLREEEA